MVADPLTTTYGPANADQGVRERGRGGALLRRQRAPGDLPRGGALRLLLVGCKTIELTIYAVYASGRHLPAKTRRSVDYLRERISDAPYWDHGLSVQF